MAVAALAMPLQQAHAATLYDGSAGTLPSAQGWMPLAQGNVAAQSVAGGRYLLNTTGAGVSAFGNGMVSAASLDTVAGFNLAFSLQITSEAHTSANRSGYSVVVVGADTTQAVELAFWGGNVWVYDYDASNVDRFVHGADALFDTSALHSYTLAVRNNRFTLVADGTTLLSGAMRNYTAGGVPYTQPNFLFFGDDSARGTSVSALSFVALSPVPEPAPAALLLAGMAALAWRKRRRLLLPSG